MGGGKVSYIIKKEQRFFFTKPTSQEVAKATMSKGAQILFEAKMKTYIRKTTDYDKGFKFGFKLLW